MQGLAQGALVKDSKSCDKVQPHGDGGADPAGRHTPDLRAADTMLADLFREDWREKRIRTWSLVVAFLFHGILLSITFPNVAKQPREFHREQKIFVLQQTRFRPPPPPRGETRPPERRKKKVPIPDPTPDDPEPIIDPEIVVPEIELSDLSDVVFGIPDAPPGGPGSPGGSGEGPFHLGGDIQRPQKTYAPDPPYTEAARMARIQGLVLLQTVIDKEGNVTNLKVLKDLPMGLTESALETVATWKFEPATRDGEPVAVYYHLSVRFSLI